MKEKIKIIPFYKTKDYKIASILYSKGLKLDNIERDNNCCYWVFCDELMCQKTIKAHYKGELLINSLSLIDAMNTIKGTIFQYNN
jgi:hypothetical protein